jgi:hypothetical protein
VNHLDRGAVWRVGESGNGKPLTFFEAVSDDQSIGTRPNGFDGRALNGRLFAINEVDDIDASQGSARNHEDALEDISDDFRTDGLADS